MPEDEEYELMPHETIAKLKHELEVLKKKVGSKEEISSKDVQKNIETLNVNINNLLSLFKEAAKGLKEEAEPGLKEQISPLAKRMERLEDENRKIAEGILVVADMVKDVKVEEKKIEKELPKLKPRPVFRQMTRPKVPMPPRPKPPMPGGPLPMHGASMPPPRPMPSQGPLPPPGLGLKLGPEKPGLKPIGPPGMPPPGPSPLPPLPEIKAEPKKEGFFSRLFKRNK